MLFSRRMPLTGLIELARALHHNLGAGLSLRDVFRQQAQRGLAPVRPVAGRISALLEKGRSLEDAFTREEGIFPPLFIDLAVVGEKTGTLPEIFGELETYYRLQQTQTRTFRSKIILPVGQFFLAVLVIAAMLYILGAIAEGQGGQAPDTLGLGLRGKQGAFLFLAGVFGLIGLGVGLYFLLTRLLQRRAAVDLVLLRLPVLGSCLRAFALGRFALALRLTLETGMSVFAALRLSLRATGNAAFVAQTDRVLAALRGGDDLTLALTKARVFPEEFLSILAVAEEGGRIPEVMRNQAQYYQEEAGRRLAALTRLAAFGVWLFYAVFMIVAIFKIAGTYFGNLPK